MLLRRLAAYILPALEQIIAIIIKCYVHTLSPTDKWNRMVATIEDYYRNY
jgi:hypothetical protein